MNVQRLISELEGLGLTTKEAAVYLACLELGAAPVQAIATRSGIKRVTVYVVLESLVARGLVSQINAAKKSAFRAEDPARIIQMLQRKRLELDTQLQKFDQILGDLKLLKDAGSADHGVTVSGGASDARVILDAFLQRCSDSGAMIYQMVSEDSRLMLQVLTFVSELRKSGRGDVGPVCRFLSAAAVSQPGGFSKFANLCEFRRLGETRQFTNGSWLLVGESCLMLNPGASAPVAVEINNPELAQIPKLLFSVAWDVAGGHR